MLHNCLRAQVIEFSIETKLFIPINLHKCVKWTFAYVFSRIIIGVDGDAAWSSQHGKMIEDVIANYCNPHTVLFLRPVPFYARRIQNAVCWVRPHALHGAFRTGGEYIILTWARFGIIIHQEHKSRKLSSFSKWANSTTDHQGAYTGNLRWEFVLKPE